MLSELDQLAADVEDALNSDRPPRFTGSHRSVSSSAIGVTCDAWLQFNLRRFQYPQTRVPRFTRLADLGNVIEPYVLYWFQQQVSLHPDTDDVQIISRNHHGDQINWSRHSKRELGYADGILWYKLHGTQYISLLEVKCVNQDRFDAVKKRGVEQGERQWYLQVQHLLDLANHDSESTQLDHAFMLIISRNSGEIFVEPVLPHPLIAAYLAARVEQQMAGGDIPIHRQTDTPHSYGCRFCEHHELCQLDVPQPGFPTCLQCRHASPVSAEDYWWCGLHLRRADNLCKDYNEWRPLHASDP